MCTLIVLDRVVPGVPLLVASNRDEYFRRPAAPPARVAPRDGRPAFVAPQDLEAGGTWMGLNESGLFVGLTNRATLRREDGRRSRGLLVLDALGRNSAEEAAAEMHEGLEGAYNPFHLLCADGCTAHLTVLRDEGATTRALEPGAHVVCNRDAGDRGSSKVGDLQRRVDALDLSRPLEDLMDGLARVLSSHAQPGDPLANACVHTPDYGTRSSTLIALGPESRHYWHSDGPPCEAKYRDLGTLLDGVESRAD